MTSYKLSSDLFGPSAFPEFNIGFDRLVEPAMAQYPPSSIFLVDDSENGRAWEAHLAVAGYPKESLKVTKKEDGIHIKGKLDYDQKLGSSALRVTQSNISQKQFHVKIPVSDLIKVDGVELTDGILKITLKEAIPEEKKPISYDIN